MAAPHKHRFGLGELFKQMTEDVFRIAGHGKGWQPA